MKCRSCKADLSLPLIDLGAAPPSNAYLTREKLALPESFYPLKVLVCERCWLVQIDEFSGGATLFSEDYAYFSSFSESWLNHIRQYVSDIVDKCGLSATSLVAEIASNDGYLLQYLLSRDIPCYGVEPTQSTCTAARKKGIETICAFFNDALALQLKKEDRQVDLAIANNVLAHVPDIEEFLRGIEILLKPDGVATFEFPHILNLVNERQFDTIYHEHYSYLSLTALNPIFVRVGLNVFDVQNLATHGGSLRLFAQRSGTGSVPSEAAVDNVLTREEQVGIRTRSFYNGMQRQAEQSKYELIKFLIIARENGFRVGGYGAAAKANTLLNFAGIRADLLPYIVDQNPAKQNKFMPGSRIPIVTEGHLKWDKPDYVVIMPWNLKDEIVGLLDYVRDWGGQFVVPMPKLEII